MNVRAPNRSRLRPLRRLLSPRRRASPAPVAAPAPSAWSPPPPPGTWLGEGIVRSVDADGRPQLLLTSGAVVTAAWALPYRYEPAGDDVLRVVGRDGRCWVVGVVHGEGRSVLAFQGGLALRARALRLSSDVALRLRAARLTLRAELVDVLTETAHTKVGRATRTIGRLLERAGASRRVVDEEDASQAKTRTILAHGPVVIDGEQLKVG